MADEFYDEDDEDDYDDYDDFIWLEDGHSLADDLAEQVVPDPVFDVVEAEWDDLTRFEFFNDIEYDSDGYHDREQKVRLMSTRPIQSISNKRKASNELRVNQKKVKLSNDPMSISLMPPVLFVSTDTSRPEVVTDVNSLPSYSLLPDWQERFKQFIGNPIRNSSSHLKSALTDGAPNEPNDTSSDDDVHIQSLRAALTEHLSSMGLSTKKFNQSLLIRLASNMMSGGEGAEDLMADVIESVYEAEETGDDHHDDFTRWAKDSARDAASSKRKVQVGETELGTFSDTPDMAESQPAYALTDRKSARADSPYEIPED